MFNDISWRSKDRQCKKECESSAQLVSLYAKRFSAVQWSFLGLDQKRGQSCGADDVNICRKPGMHSKTMSNEQRYCWQLQSHVWITNFRRENWKITMLGKSAYFFVVVSTTLQSIYSMHRWPPFQRRRNEICWRIVTSMLLNCSKVLMLGTNWTIRYSMVSEQTCKIHRKMDQGLWQALESIDFLHSSYMWIQTILSCGKHCQKMQIGTVSRLRFCRRSWGFKIHFGWNIVHFRKSYICSDQLDV